MMNHDITFNTGFFDVNIVEAYPFEVKGWGKSMRDHSASLYLGFM